MGNELSTSLAALQHIQPLLGNLGVWRACILGDNLFVQFYRMLPVVLLLFELRCFKLLFPLVVGAGAQGGAAYGQQNQDIFFHGSFFSFKICIELRHRHCNVFGIS